MRLFSLALGGPFELSVSDSLEALELSEERFLALSGSASFGRVFPSSMGSTRPFRAASFSPARASPASAVYLLFFIFRDLGYEHRGLPSVQSPCRK